MSKWRFWGRFGASALAIASGALLLITPNVQAAIPPPGEQTGTGGLQGTVQTPPPKTAATITTPRNGQTFTSMPITVAGLCPTDLLVKVFANNVFVGSAMCNGGSYSLRVNLLDGRNDIVVRVFDALDQPGPDSNVVTVTYINDQFRTTGVPLLTLTSVYARRGANPGEELLWPITVSGGTPPYAISVDWGDGKGDNLYSQAFTGTFNIRHVYESAGIYVVIVRATDKNGQTAFLQLVGQANGSVTQSNTQSGGSSVITKTVVLWVPAAIAIPLIFFSFWLGRRYELAALRRHLERPDD
jgi:hypothetical protein